MPPLHTMRAVFVKEVYGIIDNESNSLNILGQRGDHYGIIFFQKMYASRSGILQFSPHLLTALKVIERSAGPPRGPAALINRRPPMRSYCLLAELGPHPRPDVVCLWVIKMTVYGSVIKKA
ncbi:hypothetical protein EVAR_98182_1 [Eumeta japonica]|uniref:Uncharacterized protein n=1 Tax=Eumeta variegata TaxID=151549 RepID=A0A4C2A301_EUMVA|nr:hypothetical protein EVAR_98182_1 [Eumeta japonica]